MNDLAQELRDFVSTQPNYQPRLDSDLSTEDIMDALESLSYKVARSTLYCQLKVLADLKNGRGYHERGTLVVLIGWYSRTVSRASFRDYAAFAGKHLLDAYRESQSV
jgi:hypothetical protein